MSISIYECYMSAIYFLKYQIIGCDVMNVHLFFESADLFLSNGFRYWMLNLGVIENNLWPKTAICWVNNAIFGRWAEHWSKRLRIDSTSRVEVPIGPLWTHRKCPCGASATFRHFFRLFWFLNCFPSLYLKLCRRTVSRSILRKRHSGSWTSDHCLSYLDEEKGQEITLRWNFDQRYFDNSILCYLDEEKGRKTPTFPCTF